MAQGHGLSVLVRAAQITGEKRFWDAAHLALKPFTQAGFLFDSLNPSSDWLNLHKSIKPSQDAKDGGVRNKFMNQHTWYEEYPFSDGLYVLNGFMYSMIGLYDLLSADGAPEELQLTAKEIFDVGFQSLKVKFREEMLKNSHQDFRKCCRYTTMEREQITICDIT